MSTVSDRKLVEQVRDIAQSLGYRATLEPRASQIRVFGWFRGREFRPDIYLERSGRSVIVEVSSRPVLTYDIFQVDQMRRGKVIGALICVADPAYGRIKNSVMDYAEELNVHLCKLSDARSALGDLLNQDGGLI